MSSITSKSESVFGAQDISKMLDKGVSIDLYLIVELLMSMVISHHTAGRDYSPKVDQCDPKEDTGQGDNSQSEPGKASKQNKKDKAKARKDKPDDKGKSGGKSGPSDQWLSIVNKKKPSELIRLGKKIIDAVDNGEDQEAAQEIEEAVSELEKHVIAEAKEITRSLLYDKAKLVWLTGEQATEMDTAQFSEAKQKLKVAVIHLLFINEARIGLSNLRGEAKRVELFSEGDDLDSSLARIEKFRHSKAHKLQELLNAEALKYDFESYKVDVETAIAKLYPLLQDIPERIEAEILIANVLETQNTLPTFLEDFQHFQARIVELEEDVRGNDAFLANIVGQINEHLAKRGKQELSPLPIRNACVVVRQPSLSIQSTDNMPVSTEAEENADVLPELESLSELLESCDKVGDGDEYSPRNGFKLLAYQKEMVARSLKGQNDIILLPTGAGKTYIAIEVIINHLNGRHTANPKVIFIATTTELATQQLEKICYHLPAAWSHKARKITGESQMSGDELKSVIKGRKYVVLVVTPAILNNYLSSSADASISDFSLIVFDEYHHANKKHAYNEILRKYVEYQDAGRGGEARASFFTSPQLLGLTATIGIGDSKTLDSARSHIIKMCAKFDLDSPPSQSSHFSPSKPDEVYDLVESKRSNEMSDCIEKELMEFLEQRIIAKLSDPKFAELDVKPDFPGDRHLQGYEQFIVNFGEKLARYHGNVELRQDIQYCKVALDHLRQYYVALQLINLLRCGHGIDYLRNIDDKDDLKVVNDIWKRFEDTLPQLQKLSKKVDADHPNEKIVKLVQRLAVLFETRPNSKVIIFVRERIVAEFLARLLSAIPLKGGFRFKANQFTGSTSTTERAGMKTHERKDIRKGFEGTKYNILVATSLLEEGIDIQECNMVVRYMYVKNMIAKIQSRGRARHAEGQMIAILDSKLYEQEKSNDQKEELMYKALEEINAMPNDEFKIQVAVERELLFPTPPLLPEGAGNLQASAKVSCKSCGNYLSDMAKVKKYTTHYFILDRALPGRVEAHQSGKAAPEFDGIKCYGLLKCRGSSGSCGKQVGTLRKIKTGHYYGMFVLGGVMVENTPIKKYKQVQTRHNVKIEDITESELSSAAPEHSFRLS